MQPLERPLGVLELQSEFIEQFRMTGLASHATEVVGGVNDALPEVLQPNAIHDASPEQGVLWMGDPFGESASPIGLAMRFRERETGWNMI
jgi:hypothetical protein